MTPERWKLVGELFHTALDKPPEQRKRWVEEACKDDPELRAEVLSLLGSDAVAGDGFIEKKVQPAVATLLQTNEQNGLQQRVGPYRLVRELGRGGMGTVYLAERDDEEYQAQVAIKLVRRGMDTDLILSRFYRERQTLARLQHPNIARLLDGGTTAEGLPYIVMEYVEGERITAWCERRKLTVARRLQLFLNVCRAVSYAHRELVVHRDIKPGNILVDNNGEVKLLDFGICKLLQTQTPETDHTVDVGLVALTPDYASPEQIRGDPVTVASDIYSLAAVLYELLTGVKPHKIEEYTLRGMERAICETEVTRASRASADQAVARQLKGDLDNILAVALDKDPRRRYESVDQFADDLRRHLAYEPVRARADSVPYRVGKFMQRRQGLVAAAAAVMIALVVGMVVAVRSARVANENLRLVRQLANTFLFDVHDAVQELPGATRTREMIVKTGLQYLERLSGSAVDDPDFQHEIAAAYRRVGDVQGGVMNANLGNMKEAITSYSKALVLLDAVLKQNPGHRMAATEKILVLRRIGNLEEYRRNQDKAVASFLQAERLAEQQLTRFSGDRQATLETVDSYLASAVLLRRLARWDDACAKFQRVLQVSETLYASHPGDRHVRLTLAQAHSGSGACEVRNKHLQEGLAAYRRAAAMQEELLRSEPASLPRKRDLMFTYSHIGDVLGNPNLQNLGDIAGAREAYGKMLEIARGIHRADPADQRARSDYSIALSRMAVLFSPQEVAARLAMLSESIELQKQVASTNADDRSNQSDLAINYMFLGDAYLSAGNSASAMNAWREGVRVAEASNLPSPALGRGILMLYRKVGEQSADRGDRLTATEMARRAIRLVDPSGPILHRWPLNVRKALSALSVATVGHIHAALARSDAGQLSDRARARESLRRSAGLYRAFEKEPMFTKNVQRELHAVETALEELKGSK